MGDQCLFMHFVLQIVFTRFAFLEASGIIFGLGQI